MTPRARAFATSLLLVAVACIGRRPKPATEPAPTAWRDWAAVSAEVDRMLTNGNVDGADTTLAAFTRRWPGTPEAEQGAWWRVVRQAEQADDSASTAAVVARIDSLLAAAPATTRRGELTMLRRVALLSQQVRTERSTARAEREAMTKQRSDEIDRLKAELENVKAELDRVRTRVTRRRP